MAARMDAAASSSPVWCFVFMFLYSFFCLLVNICEANYVYSRQDLIDFGWQQKLSVTRNFQWTHKIPEDIARLPGSPWIVGGPSKRRRRRRDRKQKRGSRAGLLTRLRKQPHKPPLPSIFLTNARSITHKMDELELHVTANHLIRNCCVMIITETWLHPLIPDAAVRLADRSIHRQDRNMDSGKSRGGGLCIYVHNDWCNNSNTIDSHCSPDLEMLSTMCRPFYLPRELTVVIVTAVYIPPDANVSAALSQLYATVSKHQQAHPDGVHIIAGDFNQACLKTVLPKFTQYVKCATRGNNTLDHVYSNLKHAYRATPLPHLGQSDHLSLLLIPAYTPLRRKTKPYIKNIKIWPEGALSQLQDCFEHTVWDIFEQQDLEEYTGTVLSYINHCTDTVTAAKRIRVYPNQKPWMTSKVKTLLQERNSAFRSGDKNLYSTARANLKRGIKDAKKAYKEKIEDHLTNNNPRRVWQGIQNITNYKNSNTSTVHADASLAEELNHFFARFEVNRPTTIALTPPTPSSHTLTLQEHEVRCVLKSVSTRKAAGPDGVSGKVLNSCANQLAGVFTKIFNLSLTLATIPPCLKSAIIIPVPKKPAINSLNDYRPIALTPVIMKCFEKLVSRHIKSTLPPTFDSHQFAYRANRSTEDAIDVALHTALSHLELRGTYIRMLFIDYSSAFNTIIPDILVSKLTALGLSPSICTWIKDFLSNRPQTVKLGPHLSSTITLSTGSPQGCVLSPLLYSLYTHDCTPTHPTNTIIKFADDTTVIGLISEDDESAYRDEVQKLTVWCSDNNLSLNTTKTKELILDYRRQSAVPAPLYINGDCVEKVHTFKFLGANLSDDLSWSVNTSETVKKAQQRLHFLRVLRKNNLECKLMVAFYRTTIESVLTYCISAWYSGCTAADKRALQRVINTAQKITGCSLPSLESIARSRYLSRANNILKDSSHPGHHLFTLLPSGRRYRSFRARTTRLKNSFFPTAIRTLNTDMH